MNLVRLLKFSDTIPFKKIGTLNSTHWQIVSYRSRFGMGEKSPDKYPFFGGMAPQYRKWIMMSGLYDFTLVICQILFKNHRYTVL